MANEKGTDTHRGGSEEEEEDQAQRQSPTTLSGNKRKDTHAFTPTAALHLHTLTVILKHATTQLYA